MPLALLFFMPDTLEVKEYTISLEVDDISDEQMDSIKDMAGEIYEAGRYNDDIFKCTVAAVLDWLKLSLHDEKLH